MAKLVGIGQLPELVQRAQSVSIMGTENYENAGTVERVFTPYDRIATRAFGQVTSGYDLNQPGAVGEIKQAIVELANYFSDPVNRSDPATEDTWKYIDRSAEYIDAWDGPTADAFVLMLSRLKYLAPLFGMPAYTQLVPMEDATGRLTIIGGPQPTVAGLELLAQGARRILKGAAAMPRYLAWRGGSLDSWFGGPPESYVKQSAKLGRPWDPRGWTVAWREGPVAKANPNVLSQLDMVEDSIKTSWAIAQLLKNETERAERAQALIGARQDRHEIVKQLNEGAPPPQCSEGYIWSKGVGQCVDRCPSVDKKWDPASQACAVYVTPTGGKLYDSYDECIVQHVEAGFEEAEAKKLCTLEFPDRGVSAAVVAGAVVVLGAGAWWYFARRATPARGPVTDWRMVAPQD